MPYLGNIPSTSFATVVKDTFNGGSTGYTLSKVATTNSVSVFVENVRQEPTTAYSVSGTTLTFTATTPSGTGNIYVLHMNPTTTTTHPAAQNLTAVDGTFTGDVSVADDLTVTDDVAITGKTGMGISSTDVPDGGLHIHTGSAGSISANSNGDELVVESSGRGGISILTPDANESNILFGSPSDNLGGFITYKQSTATMEIGTSISSGVFKINSGDGSLGLQIDGNGHVTMSKQPAFLAYPNGDQSNMANDAVLVLDQEIYDQNADYNTSNYTFTAPVTGKYLMCVASRIDNADTSANWVRIELVTSNRSYSTSLVSPDVSPYMSIDYSIIVDMDASDTCYLRWGQSGGSATADMSDVTRWSGALIC